MWAQLAMAGLKSLQDNQNRKQDIASNVITQKYSPWTGARADFSQQGKNNTISNLISGYGSGLLQDKLDAKDMADKVAQEQAQKKAEWASDADYYSKLSANPASVGASPMAPVASNKSAFAAVANRAPASRSPAVIEGGNMEPSGAGGGFLGMLNSSNPWEQITSRPLLPSELDSQVPYMDPTERARKSVWGMVPNSLPIKQGWN
jgi:hypothetical protein